jgi:hypothetical protein
VYKLFLSKKNAPASRHPVFENYSALDTSFGVLILSPQVFENELQGKVATSDARNIGLVQYGRHTGHGMMDDHRPLTIGH